MAMDPLALQSLGARNTVGPNTHGTVVRSCIDRLNDMSLFASEIRNRTKVITRDVLGDSPVPDARVSNSTMPEPMPDSLLAVVERVHTCIIAISDELSRLEG